MNSNQKAANKSREFKNNIDPQKSSPEILNKKRRRTNEKENLYKIKCINHLKVIEYNKVDYFPVTYERDTERNTRTTNYYCDKHEEVILLGQMEAVGRHYADEHPELLPELKHVISLRNFLLFRCRVFINTLVKYYKDRIDITKRGNVKDILTQMVFDNKTIKFVDDWFNGHYDRNFYQCVSSVPFDVLNNYLELCQNHIFRFRRCIKNMNYIYFDEKNIQNYENNLKNIRFEDFSDIDLYQTQHKEAFFFITLTDDKKEKFDKIVKENKNTIDFKKFDNVVDKEIYDKSKNSKVEIEDNEYKIYDNQILRNDVEVKKNQGFMSQIYHKNSSDFINNMIPPNYKELINKNKNTEEEEEYIKINIDSIKGRERANNPKKRNRDYTKKPKVIKKDDIDKITNVEEIDINEEEEENNEFKVEETIKRNKKDKNKKFKQINNAENNNNKNQNEIHNGNIFFSKMSTNITNKRKKSSSIVHIIDKKGINNNIDNFIESKSEQKVTIKQKEKFKIVKTIKKSDKKFNNISLINESNICINKINDAIKSFSETENKVNSVENYFNNNYLNSIGGIGDNDSSNDMGLYFDYFDGKRNKNKFNRNSFEDNSSINSLNI